MRNVLHMAWYVCQFSGSSVRTRSPSTQRKAHLKLARFAKDGIPTRRASHFHWRRWAYRALHIGFEQEHAGVELGAVVGERRENPCELN